MLIVNSKIRERLIQVGFTPWTDNGLQGYYRRNTFKKDSMIGVVAEYYAEDYIVEQHSGVDSVEYILANYKAKPDVVKQRLLLWQHPQEKVKVKSFALGFKGWLEVWGYQENCKPQKKFRDLLELLELG